MRKTNSFLTVVLFLLLVFIGCNKKTDSTVSPAPAVTGMTPCKLADASGRPDVAIGFPRIASRAPSTGSVKVSVIFVDFSDAPATRTPQEVFGIISPAAENYYNAVSYNNLTLSFDPTYRWFRMSKPSSQYGWASLTFDLHKAYIQEAISLADPTVDFSKSDAFLIVSNPDGGSLQNGPAFCSSPGFGVSADGKVFLNGVTSGKDLLSYRGLWFPHEFGHNMGLPDLYAFGIGQLHRYVGSFSLMGNILGFAQEYNAWERWLLGWLNDSQVVCQSNTGSSNVTLTPLEVKSAGVKLLVVPIDANTAVLVESRKTVGYDRLPKDGPVVYFIDTKVTTGSGPLKVLPINDTDGSKAQNIMSVGQTITFGSVSIKYVSTDASGDVIQYEKK
jgi:M6 family metalloprotease-like protein